MDQESANGFGRSEGFSRQMDAAMCAARADASLVGVDWASGARSTSWPVVSVTSVSTPGSASEAPSATFPPSRTISGLMGQGASTLPLVVCGEMPPSGATVLASAYAGSGGRRVLPVYAPTVRTLLP